jgi:glycosyltransferase involved in cell wall biosynthesis
MELTYFGLLRSPVSWAKIGRELAEAFINNGDKVHVFERRGFSYNKDFKLPAILDAALVKEFRGDKALTFEHPLNYKYLTTKQKYGMLVYETTVAPKEWAVKANETLNILFLPNEFNKKIFTDAGVRPELIRVVPHGFNPRIYNPGSLIPNPELGKIQTAELGIRDQGLGIKNRFTFLAVAMPQRRKGIDVLLSAFEKAFPDKKDVELVIKFPYAPGKSKYDIKMPQLPENARLITAEYTEEQMADLYRSAGCFVLPSRAEGFGLVYLEALACGIPVIATGWGGQTEFLNEKNALLLDYKPAPAGSIQYDNENAAGLMAEPSVDDLVDKLRYAVSHHAAEADKIKNLDLSRFYWQNIAERMRGEMEGRV